MSNPFSSQTTSLMASPADVHLGRDAPSKKIVADGSPHERHASIASVGFDGYRHPDLILQQSQTTFTPLLAQGGPTRRPFNSAKNTSTSFLSSDGVRSLLPPVTSNGAAKRQLLMNFSCSCEDFQNVDPQYPHHTVSMASLSQLPTAAAINTSPLADIIAGCTVRCLTPASTLPIAAGAGLPHSTMATPYNHSISVGTGTAAAGFEFFDVSGSCFSALGATPSICSPTGNSKLAACFPAHRLGILGGVGSVANEHVRTQPSRFYHRRRNTLPNVYYDHEGAVVVQQKPNTPESDRRAFSAGIAASKAPRLGTNTVGGVAIAGGALLTGSQKEISINELARSVTHSDATGRTKIVAPIDLPAVEPERQDMCVASSHERRKSLGELFAVDSRPIPTSSTPASPPLARLPADSVPARRLSKIPSAVNLQRRPSVPTVASVSAASPASVLAPPPVPSSVVEICEATVSDAAGIIALRDSLDMTMALSFLWDYDEMCVRIEKKFPLVVVATTTDATEGSPTFGQEIVVGVTGIDLYGMEKDFTIVSIGSRLLGVPANDLHSFPKNFSMCRGLLVHKSFQRAGLGSKLHKARLKLLATVAPDTPGVILGARGSTIEEALAVIVPQIEAHDSASTPEFTKESIFEFTFHTSQGVVHMVHGKERDGWKFVGVDVEDGGAAWITCKPLPEVVAEYDVVLSDTAGKQDRPKQLVTRMNLSCS